MSGRNHTLRPTELAHEVLERLARRDGALRFTGIEARAIGEMERALIDHARKRASLKRGGIKRWEAFDLSVHRAVERVGVDAVELADVVECLRSRSETQANLFELRSFDGLSNREVALELGLSERSVDREWWFVERWMLRELYGPRDGE